MGITNNTWDLLRDLADKVEKVVRDHKASSMVLTHANTFTEYLRLLARVHEINAEAVRRDRAFVADVFNAEAACRDH